MSVKEKSYAKIERGSGQQYDAKALTVGQALENILKGWLSATGTDTIWRN